jgi:hypothetical protein
MPAIGETALGGPPPKLAVGPPKPTQVPSVQSVIRGVANQAAGAATRSVGATVRAAAPTARPAARAVIAPQRGVQSGPIVPTGPAYRQAVLDTFAHQPLAARQAVIKGALRTPSFEGNLILSAIGGHGIPSLGQQMTGTGGGKGLTQYLNAQNAKSPNLGMALSNALGTGENFLMGLHNQATAGPVGSRISQAGFGAGNLGSTLVRAPIDVARATLESPSTVIPKTVSGLGDLAVGGLASLFQVPYNAVTQGPGKAFSDLVGGLAQNYKSRYGPLMAGNDRAFIDRIKKQGASQEVLDLLGTAGGLDLTAGRAVSQASAAGEGLSGADAGSSFLTRARPGLRVSGNDVRAQNLAPTALRATGQRLEDRLRTVKETRAPGEIPPRPGEVRPLFGNRSQRVLASNIAQKYRRVMQEKLNTEVRRGAGQKMVRLSRWEKKAAPVALEGIIPLDRGVAAATDAIDQRMAMIVKDRAENPASPGNHIAPSIAGQVDELHNLQLLKDNASKWVTPRLSAFVKGEGVRAGRLEAGMPDSFLRSDVAEARRLRPQGEMLGIAHPDEINARRAAAAEVAARGAPKTLMPLGAQLNRERKMAAASSDAAKYANFDESRPGLLKDYSTQVRAAAQAKGLPEPSYFKHQDIPSEKLGAYTSGTGHAAMPGTKQSSFALFKGGAVDRNPQLYLHGLAKSIKVGHQWPLVDEQFRRSAFPPPSAQAIKDAGFGGRSAASLTGRELSKVMLHEGHDLKDVKFYSPGRLRETTLVDRGAPLASRSGSAPPELEANADIAHALNQNDAVQSGKDVAAGKMSDTFVKSPGFKAIPKTAFDEIHSSLKPSGLGGRLVGKAQGATAAAILGGSPSFVVMNTLAHAVLAAFGTRGWILTDMVKSPLWFHGLTDEEKNIVRSNAGGRGRFGVERLGSTAPNALANSWQKLKDAGIGRFTVGGTASTLNPLRLLFRAEDLQSNYFRNMVYYSATKRAALDSIAKDMGPAAALAARLSHVFTLGPKDQMIAQISDMHTAEALGRYTVNMMGDYARFTATERKFLNNRAVLFYSFLRHATRTLLYVLPLHHPLATALVGDLAQMHNDEVKKLLGGANLPYAYSRLFFDKNGKLTSIDFNRASPVGSIGAEVGAQGIAGVTGLIPPELQPVLNMLYKHTPTGAPVQTNLWSLLNGYGSLSYPYRMLGELHNGTTLQQSDSIPFIHERPQVKKTAAAQKYQAAKEAALGPSSQQILAGLLGLFPKPDDTGVIAANQNAKVAAHARNVAKKAGGAGGYLLGGSSGAPSGSGGGGYLLGTGSGASGGYLLP